MEECIRHECYYWLAAWFIDDCLEYFQEDEDRMEDFEEWQKQRTINPSPEASKGAN